MERIAPLTVVEASAGTGKTYALVTRLLTLIFCGVEPEKIVALTFSRLAAGEIFNTFVERLSKAAETPEGAAKESRTLNLGREISQAEFAAMLRKVIAHQHLSLIGTLDSFLMRVIRMVPFELGLAGEITVMSEYRSPLERTRLVGDMLMLNTIDAKEVFRKAFSGVFAGAGAQNFLATFSEFIAKWHARYRDHPDSAEWGSEERIWGTEAPRRPEISLMDIRLNAAKFALMAEKSGVATFIEAIANYGGETPPKIPKVLAHDAEALSAVKKMCDYRIAESLRTTRGIYTLMWIFEKAYASSIRARGLISFDDLPRLLMGLSEETRLALEYRMDARFDHWALDEFQDTSRGQWNAIKNLIEENSLPDGNKTVFIVGDRKQSIYEWREGDVRILGEQVELAKKAPNRLQPLDESYRYRSEISLAVNKVFETSVIRGLFEMDDAPANAIWECREHESHDKVNEGFVEVSEAPKREGQGQVPVENFFEPVANALRAVKPWERGITCAILVRKNDFGEKLLAYLKQNGFADYVVFEGDMPIFDSPVLGAFAALLKLAEHAGDTYAYAQIKYSPLAKALYPNGLPSSAELSAALLADFTRLGMVRKFRAVREALKGVADSWDEDFTESRFEDFIKCAAEFEDMREANMRLSDFIAFVEQKNSRDFADASKVRILTMHRSKGLGFDYVIIPFHEREGLSGDAHQERLAPLTQENPAWILQHPGILTAESDSVLGAAERRRKQSQIYASLCLDYVAMTRAKKALTLILHPATKTKSAVPNRFSDLVREVGLKTFGNPAWYLEEHRDPNKKEAEESAAPNFKRPARQNFAKVRPGEAFRSGICGDTLFMDTFGAAAERGTELHEEFARIEWLPESAAKSPFEKALVKPVGVVELWRERAYELITEGAWQSGQFDRVVFVGEGAARRATIYDFKTNAVQKGETSAAFSARMVRTYAHQMRTYRAALATLTGLAPAAITTTLLLHATRDAATVD